LGGREKNDASRQRDDRGPTGRWLSSKHGARIVRGG
jgi:hypothetical protein